ncbi:hypothetical protein [Pedobacter psychrodurus]|uniref:hypothetical protein n=1 Tax=Pedobacter psychrodurus TaxID=2530456 RepID=UPI00292EA0EB|nr:hypothetical protein [Pedobacter psychrodurus]
MVRYPINNDTFRRYHLGECTAEESAAVAAWLEEGEEEPVFSHDVLTELRMEQSLWAAIEQSTVHHDSKRRRLRLLHSGLVVAGGFALLFICAALYFGAQPDAAGSRTVLINNLSGGVSKRENIDGLIFTALPKGNISANIAHSSGNVTFCDVMLIENNSVKDISLNFASNCSQNGKAPKNFICKKGVTYVALKMSRISPDIIVVDQRYMEDFLPLNLAMQINKDLKSI